MTLLTFFEGLKDWVHLFIYWRNLSLGEDRGSEKLMSPSQIKWVYQHSRYSQDHGKVVSCGEVWLDASLRLLVSAEKWIADM